MPERKLPDPDLADMAAKLADDDPVPLKLAVELFFPYGGMTVRTLRGQRDRGNLVDSARHLRGVYGAAARRQRRMPRLLAAPCPHLL